MATISKKLAAKQEMWRRGNLYWKCHPVQKEMYDIFYKSPDHSTLVWLLSRQTGKSFLLSMLAIEQAIREPNSLIKILTDTKLHAKSIIKPIFDEILDDGCPDDIKPKYNEKEYAFKFGNGSEIQLAGSDGKHFERLRGQKSNLCLVDEAGFCNDLEEVVKSVLLPTTTHTGGKIVLSSTPPIDSDHDFVKFIEEAEMNKTITKKTIFDNPLLNKDQIDRIIKEMGGLDSIKFRREYLVEIIRDEDYVIIPEFTEELERKVVKVLEKPKFFETYEAMDLGFKDLTVVLFAYFDFKLNKVVVEDEIVLKGKDVILSKLAEAIRLKEIELWANRMTGEINYPKIRVSDINYIVTQELYRASNGNLSFLPARKDDKEASINDVRQKLLSEQIVINPKCVTLIRHVRNAKRDKSSQYFKFTRSADDGHYDALDALCYLIRHINYKSNPYPANLGAVSGEYYSNRSLSQPASSQVEVFKSLFNKRK